MQGHDRVAGLIRSAGALVRHGLDEQAIHRRRTKPLRVLAENIVGRGLQARGQPLVIGVELQHDGRRRCRVRAAEGQHDRRRNRESRSARGAWQGCYSILQCQPAARSHDAPS